MMISVPCIASLALPLGLHSPLVSRTLDWVLLLANITIAVTLVAIRVKFRRDITVGSIVVALAVFIAARGVPYLIMIVAPPTSFLWLTTNAKLIAALASLCVASMPGGREFLVLASERGSLSARHLLLRV